MVLWTEDFLPGTKSTTGETDVHDTTDAWKYCSLVTMWSGPESHRKPGAGEPRIN